MKEKWYIKKYDKAYKVNIIVCIAFDLGWI